MKRIIIVFITVIALASGYKTSAQAGINFNTFYTELSPYGRWVNNNDYGQVWIANETGFEPYSNSGHWEYTTYGWTWVSDYAWGWAPFHYGRWAYIPAYGWAWVPGYEWAPAWVSWCQYDGYYGWAPLSPGFGFNMGFNSIPVDRWRFVRYQYINNVNVYRHYERPVKNVNVYNNVTIINNTQVNNNVTYAAGPQQAQVEKLTRKKIEPKEVAFTPTAQKTAIVKGQIKLYRPEMNKGEAATQNGQPVVSQPVKPVVKENAGPIKRADEIKNNTVQPATKNDGKLQPLKGREPQQPVKDEEIGQPAAIKKQPVQTDPVKQPAQVEQQILQQQNDIKKQREDQQQLKQQQEAEQLKAQQQNELRKQQEDQQQLKQQQQAEQQRIQQQNEQRQQQAEQERLRQQNEIRQQKIQQQQERQQQLQQQRRDQQQQMKRQEREQRALPQQQPQPKNNPAPAPPEKKGKG